MKKQIPFALLISAFLLAIAPTTVANIITVDDDAPADYDNIQEAINAAVNGDTVLVANGTYTGHGNRDIDFFGKEITLRSTDPNDPCVVAATVIDCDGSEAEPHRGFIFYYGEDANSVLNGLTITNGYTNNGGGLRCLGSSPTILNCTFSDNTSEDNGGGFYNGAGNPTIINCTFSGNTSGDYGGGMFSIYKNSPTLTNCTFINNSGRGGGGMYNENNSNPTLTNCNFSCNSAIRTNGGGMSNLASGPTLTNCSFTGNSADFAGGGMYNSGEPFMESPPPTLTNCTFSGNTSEDYGGGMFNQAVNTKILNCTFNNNSSNEGGGIFNRVSSIIVTMSNSICWDDTPSEIDGECPIAITYSDVQGGWPGVGNIDADPLFIDPCNGNYHLLPDSPCIDAGDLCYVPAPNETDLDVTPRIIGGRIDMGAYEFNPDASFIVLSPSDFSFIKAHSNPPPQTLLIKNCGANTLNWQIIEDCIWLEANPASGAISTGEVSEVTLSVDYDTLPGSHSCIVNVVDPNAVNNPQSFNVAFNVFKDVIYVPDEAENIRFAIEYILDGGTIIMADGTYSGTGNSDIDFFGRPITIKSQNGPEDCIIDCQATEDEQHRAFYFHNGEEADSVLDGLTIRNGWLKGDYGNGGGIYCCESSPNIKNCILNNNKANKGGGIYCEKSSPLISNCIITDNMASNGAAIYCRDSNSIIENCKITQNCAWSSGGGIFCRQNSSPVITNCLISENLAEYGGGICWWDGSPTISNCNITKNTAADYSGTGGGIYCSGSTPAKVINCTITENKTENDPGHGAGGGGIFCGGTLDIINCTICDNIDPEYGGISYGDSNMVVVNCIIRNNTARQIGHASDDDLSCSVTYSNILGGWPGQGNIDTDPCFAFAGDYHLASDSPCIDAGDPNYTSETDETDFDGNPRISQGRIDMGAYEFNPNSPSIAVSARSFTFRSNWPLPAPQNLFIRNCGGGTLNWQITENCDWLEAIPTNGTSTGQVNEVILTADPGNLELGSYSCVLTVTDSDAVNSPITIQVQFHVGEILSVPQQFGTIQQAIDAAEDYDVVLVADGIYTGDGNRDLQLTGKSITVRSENGPQNTIIDCEGTQADPHRGLNFKNNKYTNAVFDGFTVTNGFVTDDDPGSGIECKNNLSSTLTISNCNITNNNRSGLYIADGIYFLNNCWINNNIPGIIFSDYLTSLTINNCTITENKSTKYSGGGILAFGGYLTINNSTISSNSAAHKGGGICSETGFLTINNCTISDNTVMGRGGSGGGISVTDSIYLIHNSAITGNTSETNGGGLDSADSSSIIIDCDISGNSSLAQGGGICFEGHDYTSKLTNCIISSNSSAAAGAGIHFFSYKSDDLTLNNCRINGNSSAADGGAIYFSATEGGCLTLADCQINDNSAENGGGIYCDDEGGSLKLTNSVFNSNLANDYGGAVYCFCSEPTITNCTITRNSARCGAGIECIATKTKITNCNISANIADNHWGGISCSGITEITNCKITGNQASYGLGGGIRSVGTITITNSTIAANRALGNIWFFGGGGICCDGYNDLTITNSILWGNEAVRGPQIYLTTWGGAESDVQVTYSDIQDGWPGIGNIDASPSFVDTGFWDDNGTPADANDDLWFDGDYYLLPDSPCIDTGDPYYVPVPDETDLDGNPRVIGGRIDMGAYEANYIQARLWLFPRKINRQSKMKRVMAWLQFPEGITKDQIDQTTPLLLYPGHLEPINQYIFEHGQKGRKRTSIFLLYDKTEFLSAVSDNGLIDVQVIGSLNTGQQFYGNSFVTILDRPRPRIWRWRKNK